MTLDLRLDLIRPEEKSVRDISHPSRYTDRDVDNFKAGSDLYDVGL